MLKFFREKMKAIMITIAVIFAATMFYGLGYKGLKGGPVQRATNEGLATVNGRQVDIFRFNQMVGRLMAAQTKGSRDPMAMLYMQNVALAQLIDFTVILQAGEGQSRIGGEEIDKAVTDIMYSNKIPDLKTFQNILRSQGFSLDDLRRMIKDEIIVQRFVAKMNGEVSVSPDDMREVRAQHILIRPADGSKKSWDEALKQAESVLAQAKSGKDFNALAKEYSQDPGNAKKGGDLGFFKKGAMVKEFDTAVFALKPGEVSQPVKTQFGYHIIKMDESRLVKGADKEKILAEKKDRLFKEWLEGRKEKSRIEIKNYLLNAFNMMLKNDQSGAVMEFKKAAEAEPQSPYPHLFFGNMLVQMGNSSSASEEFGKAANLAGPDPYAHLYIGKACLNTSRTSSGKTAEAMAAEALSEFQKASVLAGENRKIREDLAASFKELKMKTLLSEENGKLEKIKEKEKFEEEIKKKMGTGTSETEIK